MLGATKVSDAIHEEEVMCEVMIVDPRILPDAPEAFQEYVKKFFVEKKILGQRCLVAGRSAFVDQFGKGTAPSHSMELRGFKDGLPQGQELGSWIHEQEKKGKGIWLLHGPNPPSLGAFDDD